MSNPDTAGKVYRVVCKTVRPEEARSINGLDFIAVKGRGLVYEGPLSDDNLAIFNGLDDFSVEEVEPGSGRRQKAPADQA